MEICHKIINVLDYICVKFYYSIKFIYYSFIQIYYLFIKTDTGSRQYFDGWPFF